jgi:hypothetical protein
MECNVSPESLCCLYRTKNTGMPYNFQSSHSLSSRALSSLEQRNIMDAFLLPFKSFSLLYSGMSGFLTIGTGLLFTRAY